MVSPRSAVSATRCFFFSSRRRHTRYWRDWSSDVCSSDLNKISNAVAWESCSFSGAAYNYADRIIDFGSEGHIFTIKWSSGPLKFVDNWLEGASSSFLTAGSGNPNFLPNENIFDLEVRNNRFTKPAAWMTVSGGGLVLKNNAELKSCTHCLFDGNIFEY